MFIETVPNRTSPPAILLRESYRDEAGKAQKRTLANLSKLPASLIAGLKGLLKGGVAMPTTAGIGERGGAQDRAVAAARPCRGGARHAAQDPPGPIAAQHGEGRGVATFLRPDGRTDRRPIAGVALEVGLRARDQRRDGEQQPGRAPGARRGGGPRGLFCARLVARAATARRERLGAAASEARHAGSLRRQFILPRGPQMPAGAARLQTRPSAGPAADRLRPAVHARRLAGGGGGVRRQYGRPGDSRRPDRQAEAALRA